MAKQAGTTDKLRKEIKSLELEDIAVEKEVRKGLLTIEEGKKRKAEVGARREKISKELQQESATEQPHEDRKHKDDKHGKKQLIPTREEVGEAGTDNVTSPTNSSATEVSETVSTPPSSSTSTTASDPEAPSTTVVNLTPVSSSEPTANTTTPPDNSGTSTTVNIVSPSSATQDAPEVVPQQNQAPTITYSEPKPAATPLNTQSQAATSSSSANPSSTFTEGATTTPFTVLPPTPIAKRTILKAIGKAALQKTGSVYKYTPLGFLVGQLDLGEKEREFAKTTTKNILSAPKTLTKASSNAAKTGAITALKYTPGGLLWEHLVPEKIKTNLSAALHTNFIKDPPLKIDIKMPAKIGGKKGVDVYSKLYKYTPLGLIWKNFVPKKTKDMLEDVAKNPNKTATAAKTKISGIKIKEPQILKDASKYTSNAYKNLYKYTPLGLLNKAIPESKKQQAKKTLKSAKDYQKFWNKSVVTNALKKGYDRFGLLQKIRNAKIWKTKAWKYGKYAVSPLGAAMYDRKQYLKKTDPKTQNGQSLPPSKLRTALQGKNPYAEWTSPRSLSNKFWNTAWNKFGTPGAGNVNNALGRKIGNKAGGSAAKKATQQIGKKVTQTIVQGGARAILLNPGTLTAIGIVLLVLLAVVTLLVIIASITGGDSSSGNGNDDENNGSTPVANPIPGFTLSLTGPPSINTCENTTAPDCVIEYTATYSYTASSQVPLESITIHNNIPAGTVFESATGDYQQEGTRISWPLNRVNNQTTLTFKIRPTSNNIRVTNTVFANTTFTGGSGNLSNILPPSIESSEAVDAAQQQVVGLIAAAPDLITSYQAVERATGVPWQVLAGIHYREGSLDPNVSLASGRRIGEREPDIERGTGCNPTYIEGEPVALPGGGCGFRTFTDSAIFAANHLKGKNGGTVPASFQELAKSLAYYNGYPGNSNCYHGAPYPNCPAQFPGDDNNYVMSLFDKTHEIMYIIFCNDGVKCNPPNRDSRLGVASVIMGLNRFYTTTQQ